MTATNDSWVLITGASSGFGVEFARQYAAQGHPLVLVARRLDRLETLAEELRRQYAIDVVVERVDLSDVAAVIQLHQRLRERGIAIDILINNAGHGLQGTFVDGTLDAALAMLRLDVVSLTAVTHVFAQDMRTRGRGKILLVASLLAYQGVEKFAVYAARLAMLGTRSRCVTDPSASPGSRYCGTQRFPARIGGRRCLPGATRPPLCSARSH